MSILKPRFLHYVSTKLIYKPTLKFQNFYISKRFCSNKVVTMSSNSGINLQEIIKKLQQIAPLNLAESWDNVGLLVEPNPEAQINSILLTIDLTEDVVLEAIAVGSQLIISYHPNIFRPLKSVTQSSWKERIIVQCIKNNISVFSPHTSWDAMANGVNDWLGSALPINETKPILPNKENPNIGMGRVLTIKTLPLKYVIDLIKDHIGIPHLRIGIGRAKNLDSPISIVALCAGSGASVLGTVAADLYLTGEMSHHEVLEATQRGISVILCNHSDSERGFLKIFQKLFANEHLAVHVSQQDRDCLTTV
ncbi:NIF3-like protein 1 [Euwallacea similis]|uniref:NIF3-like protein 1 n=1 Tax=Euwallacea similis TaxID=1736056 RepID=UPI00344D1C5E